MPDLDFTAIPAPGRKCMVCGCDLAQVPKHPSLLSINEHDQTDRRDVCPDCWEKMSDRQFFSFWLTQREAPKPDQRIAREQQKATLFRMFEQMAASGEERFRPYLYVLAHALMKKRVLKWEGSEKAEDGVEHILFRNPNDETVYKIEEVNLEDEKLVAVMREIESMANGAQTSASPLAGNTSKPAE